MPVVVETDRTERAKDAEARFCRQITGRNETPPVEAYCNSSTFLATAGGIFLGWNCNGADFKRKRFDELLTRWNNLPEKERRPGAVKVEDEGARDPEWASFDPPPRHLALKVFIKNLKRDERGELVRDKYIFPTERAERTDAYRDTLWLTEAEWKSLIPARPQKGDRFPVADSIRERLFRFGLMERYRATDYPWARAEIRSGALTVTVEEVRATSLRLRLDGRAVIASQEDVQKSDKGYTGNLLGFLEFDSTRQVFTRFDLLALGENWWNKHDEKRTLLGSQSRQYVHEEEYRQLLGRRLIVGVAFELAPSDSAFARTPPGGTNNWASFESYWGTAKGR